MAIGLGWFEDKTALFHPNFKERKLMKVKELTLEQTENLKKNKDEGDNNG